MDHFEHIARASVDRLIEALGLSPKNRAEAYDRLAIHLRAGFVDVYAALARHDRRIAELLEANNREVERRRAAYLTGGHYGVTPWDGQSGAVPAYAKNNNGPWSVQDPRLLGYDANAGAPDTSEGVKWGEYHQPALPSPNDRLVAVIRALDGTWHRPFTTLDLAALQSMVDPEQPGFLWLAGNSDSQWREWIGNAVPEDAAEAMAGEFFRCLLLAWSGETFILSDQDIWVQPLQIALSLAQGTPA